MPCAAYQATRALVGVHTREVPGSIPGAPIREAPARTRASPTTCRRFLGSPLLNYAESVNSETQIPRPSWYGPDFPEYRVRRPWVMEDMIAAQVDLPAVLAEQDGVVARIANRVSAAVSSGAPVTVTGCGTAGHAARGFAAVVNAALAELGVAGGPVQWRQPFEAAGKPWPGLLIAVSHGARSTATLAALEAARGRGASTVLVTATARAGVDELADLVLNLPMRDRSWCHTLAYLSPIVVAAAVADHLRAKPFQPAPLEQLIRQLLGPSAAYGAIASAISRNERIATVGTGADLITARELALKISEATWVPACAHELEDVLHGHLVPHDERSALIAVVTESGSTRSIKRTASLFRTARRIGLATALVATKNAGAEEIDEELTSAGRSIAPDSSELDQTVGSLVAGGVALQRLTLELAHELRRNPDLLRRDEAAYREARNLAEAKLPDEHATDVTDENERAAPGGRGPGTRTS